MKSMSIEKVKIQPAYIGAPLIPQINLQVSVDTYYNFIKAYRGGFNWDFTLSIKEVSETQKYLLNFLSENASWAGRLTIIIFCQRFGECEQKQFHITRIKTVVGGWQVGDDY